MKNLCYAKEHSRKAITLTQRTARIGQGVFSYRLLATCNYPCKFFVMICEENGVGAIKSLGKDLAVAEEIYALLHKHTVAPCHLDEIADELLEQAGE